MKKKDWILIGIVIFIAGLVYLIYHLVFEGQGNQVEIQWNQELYGTYSLEEDRVIELKAEDSYNRIVIRDGSVWVEDADCRDWTCVHQGRIEDNGETIICLPNRVTVRILSDGQSGLDGVTY